MQEIFEIETSKPLSIAEKQRTGVLRANEIFYSLQGEGSRAGDPCVFVRMTGCGLRCGYCDTEYAFYEGQDRQISEIIEEVVSYQCKLVELTGGEPLEQEGVYALMDELLQKRLRTDGRNGRHVDISRIDLRVNELSI